MDADLIASLVPAEAAQTLPLQLDATALLVTAALALGTSVLVGLFPALHSDAARRAVRAEGAVGPAGRRRAARAIPHDAGDGADRAVDGARRPRGPLHEEPRQHQPRRSGMNLDGLVTFEVSPERTRYTPERTRAAHRAARRRTCRAAWRDGRHLVAGGAARGRATGDSVRVEGFKRARTRTRHATTTRSAPATSARWACR